MATLQSMGCTKVDLQVRSTNAAAVELYESPGFEVEERVSMGMRIGGLTRKAGFKPPGP